MFLTGIILRCNKQVVLPPFFPLCRRGCYLIHLDFDPRDLECSLELERDLDLELEELLEWDLKQHGRFFPVFALHSAERLLYTAETIMRQDNWIRFMRC